MTTDLTLGGLLATDTPHIDDNAPNLDDLKKMFREAASSAEEARQIAFRCADFYHGEQIDAHLRATLRRRRQPETYWNKIRPAIDGTLGLMDQSSSDPEAVARNDNGEEAATVVTKVLRYLSDKTDLEETKRALSEDALIYGACAAIVDVDRQDDARVSHIPFTEFYYDPYAKRFDYLDAQYLIHARWTDLSAAQRQWPDKASEITSSYGGSDLHSPEDQPEFASLWVDGSRRRVLIVNCYYRDKKTGVWMHAIYCHSALLEHGQSDFLDDQGEPVCPIVALAFAIDRDGRRYSMVKDMVPLQNAINGLDSRTMHLANATQVEISDDNALQTDADIARTEAARADGVIPKGYRKVPATDMFQGATLKLNQYITAIERMAPTPSVLGRAEGANQSGRARQVAAAAGFTELARFFARAERLEERIYEQMWFRAKQYMGDPRLIRVTDDAGARQSLMVNYPITRPMPVLHPVTGPDGQPVIDPHTGQPAMQPVIGPDGQAVVQPQQVGMQNHLATMDMEITINTVRQSVSLRQEAIDAMLEFSAKVGVSVLDPQFEFLLELSNIPDKAEILEKYNTIRQKAEAQSAQGQAAQQQAQAQQQAIATQTAQARIGKDTAQAERDQALAQKHLIESHDQALDLAVKESAVRQAASHSAFFTQALGSALGQPSV